MNKEQNPDIIRFYIDKVIEYYSGHMLTNETLLDMVMILSKESVNLSETIRIINTEYNTNKLI